MNGSARAVAVRFPQAWFERYSLDGPPKGFGRNAPLHRDETVRTLARLMCEEVGRGGANGRLYSESLSMALFSYVMERVPAAPARASGALSDGQRRNLQHYVANSLHEDLSLSDLSARVGLGARHFSKLFQQAFGTTPHQYVLQARLAEGARLLSDGKHAIAAIAFHVGFSSQSHFTAAFRRVYGVTPRRYVRDSRARSP
jgi:AraC family transcriptional regulator